MAVPDIVYNAEAIEAVRSEKVAEMRQKISDLNDTIRDFERQASDLEQQAIEQDVIAATATKTEYYTDSKGRTRTRQVPDMEKRAAAAAKAAELRSQANALRQSCAAMRTAVTALTNTIAATNEYINTLLAIVQNTDLGYAQRIQQTNAETLKYIEKMQGIFDSFNDSFPLTSEDIGVLEQMGISQVKDAKGVLGGLARDIETLVNSANTNAAGMMARELGLPDNAMATDAMFDRMKSLLLANANVIPGRLTRSIPESILDRYCSTPSLTELDVAKQLGSVFIANPNMTTHQRAEILRKLYAADASISNAALDYLVAYSVGTQNGSLGMANTYFDNLGNAIEMYGPMSSIYGDMKNRFATNPNKNLAANTMNHLGMFGELTVPERIGWGLTLGVFDKNTVYDFFHTDHAENYPELASLTREQLRETLTADKLQSIYDLPSQHPTAGEGNDENNYNDPAYKEEYGYNHTGLDISGGAITAGGGTIEIYSATSGKIGGRRLNGNGEDPLGDPGYSPGNYAYVVDGNGSNIWYGHMREDSIIPELDTLVLPGQRIGTMGRTGNSDGNHLHLEVQLRGGNWGTGARSSTFEPGDPQPVNPKEYSLLEDVL